MENKSLTSKIRRLFEYASLWILLSPGGAALAQDSPSVIQQRAFLKKYCVTCHNDKVRTAGLSLENVNLGDVTQSGEALEKVVRKLGSGAMPPPSAPPTARRGYRRYRDGDCAVRSARERSGGSQSNRT